MIGLARGSEHAIVVLACYLAKEIDGLDTKEYLSHLRTFERWPKRALVRKGKQKALDRLPNEVRICSARTSAGERSS